MAHLSEIWCDGAGWEYALSFFVSNEDVGKWEVELGSMDGGRGVESAARKFWESILLGQERADFQTTHEAGELPKWFINW
jgi:hypothetical protein